MGSTSWRGFLPTQRGPLHSFTPSHLRLLIPLSTLWGQVPRSQKLQIPFSGITQKEGNPNRDLKEVLYTELLLSCWAKNESNPVKRFCKHFLQRLIMRGLTNNSNREYNWLLLTGLLAQFHALPPIPQPLLAVSMAGLQSNLPRTSCFSLPFWMKTAKKFSQSCCRFCVFAQLTGKRREIWLCL